MRALTSVLYLNSVGSESLAWRATIEGIHFAFSSDKSVDVDGDADVETLLIE